MMAESALTDADCVNVKSPTVAKTVNPTILPPAAGTPTIADHTPSARVVPTAFAPAPPDGEGNFAKPSVPDAPSVSLNSVESADMKAAGALPRDPSAATLPGAAHTPTTASPPVTTGLSGPPVTRIATVQGSATINVPSSIQANPQPHGVLSTTLSSLNRQSSGPYLSPAPKVLPTTNTATIQGPRVAIPNTPNTPYTQRPTTTPAPRPVLTPVKPAQYGLGGGVSQASYAQTQYIRTQPLNNVARPTTTYVKTEKSAMPSGPVSQSTNMTGLVEEGMDEDEAARVRAENCQRKKRWRTQNADRNKDNDLRCRVRTTANKIYGTEPSKEKEDFAEAEFIKRRAKRHEKEGKGPDGKLLVEGTDLSSLDHTELTNVIMTTLTEFATNPAAPLLKDNADLNEMLQTLRTNPQSIRALFTGTWNPSASGRDSFGRRDSDAGGNNSSGDDGDYDMVDQDDEDDDDAHSISQNGFSRHDPIDMTATPSGDPNGVAIKTELRGSSVNVSDGTADKSLPPPIRRESTASNDGRPTHQIYGIGSGFETKAATILTSELFKLISMQPRDQRAASEKGVALPQERPASAAAAILTAKSEQEA